MNSLERMQAVFAGRPTDIPAVAPHGYGFYKFQFAGLARDFDDQPRCLAMTGLPRAEVEFRFYEHFRPDWIYLEPGPFERTADKLRRLADGKLLAALWQLDSEAAIDDYVDALMPRAEEFLNSDIFSHVPYVMERCGRDVFVALTWSAPSSQIFAPEGILGFEAGLMALTEKPEMVKHLFDRMYERQIEFDKALAQTGVHAHIGGESYLSADLISPAIYRDIAFPAQERYYAAATAQGVIPIMCFWGDFRPLIDDFNRLTIGGLMMDESKKGFVLDVGEIRRKLRRDIALFGNVDSVDILLKGTPADVEKAVIAQLDAATAAENGSFVVRNGSPFCPDTPPENIDAMIAAARGYRRPGACQCDSATGTKQ
jgi:hypothetical protein